MLTRMAIFNGTVKPGQAQAMRDWCDANLVPLWRQFACAHDVRVTYGVTQDPNGPEIPLILAITYASQADMAAALDSPARYTSRDMLPDFYARFFEDVTLWHYVLTD
jgi:hypothetical protein